MIKAIVAALLVLAGCNGSQDLEGEAFEGGEIGEKSQAVWYIPFPCTTTLGESCNTPRNSLTETRWNQPGRVNTAPGSGAWGTYQEFWTLPEQNNRVIYMSWVIDSTQRCHNDYCTFRICLDGGSCKTTTSKTGTTGIFMNQPLTQGQVMVWRVYFESRLDLYNSFNASLTFTHDPVW